MANPKNTKLTAPAGDALLTALGESTTAAAAPATGTKAPAVPAEPVAHPPLAVGDEDPTVGERIKALIEALGHGADDVASIEVRPRQGIIRLIGTDRSARSRRFEVAE